MRHASLLFTQAKTFQGTDELSRPEDRLAQRLVHEHKGSFNPKAFHPSQGMEEARRPFSTKARSTRRLFIQAKAWKRPEDHLAQRLVQPEGFHPSPGQGQDLDVV